MEKILFSVIYFIIIFILSMIVFIFINRKRKTYKTGKFHSDIDYLIRCGNINTEQTPYKVVRRWSTLIDCFIISFSAAVLIQIDSFLWKVVVGFVLLIILIYCLYNIFGKLLKIKENKKNKKVKTKKQKK